MRQVAHCVSDVHARSEHNFLSLTELSLRILVGARRHSEQTYSAAQDRATTLSFVESPAEAGDSTAAPSPDAPDSAARVLMHLGVLHCASGCSFGAWCFWSDRWTGRRSRWCEAEPRRTPGQMDSGPLQGRAIWPLYLAKRCGAVCLRPRSHKICLLSDRPLPGFCLPLLCRMLCREQRIVKE